MVNWQGFGHHTMSVVDFAVDILGCWCAITSKRWENIPVTFEGVTQTVEEWIDKDTLTPMLTAEEKEQIQQRRKRKSAGNQA